MYLWKIEEKFSRDIYNNIMESMIVVVPFMIRSNNYKVSI